MEPEEPPTAPTAPDIGFVLDLSPLALVALSPTWRITWASSCFLTGWGVAAPDCLGQPLLSFLAAQLRPPRPAHIAQLTVCIDDAIACRAERTSKPIHAGPNASWKVRVIPVFKGDELLSVLLEWHKGPPGLEVDEVVTRGLSNDESFRILVQAVKDYAIFLLDTEGFIASWNTGAQLLKGYKADEIIGKHFSIFYGKEDLDSNKPGMELEICMREGRVEDEGWRYRKDGSRFWANVTITAVYKNGVHVGFGKVTRDLTERKSAESRLLAAYEESEKLKSDFLANMSHEIRTPMHGMLSACTLLLDTPLSPRQRDIVAIMDESGQVLLQVINDILDYSKLTSGGFAIHSDIVGITSIVTSVVRTAQTSLPPSVHFELFLAPELPRSVQGDPLRYRQVLQNIVGNATKFTQKGSIRVRVSVQSEDEDHYMVLTEVTDTGIGIADAAAASLFTPFTQFDATTTKLYKGTGLGLSIAKSLTELMGGRIGYRPNPERQGSVFWFTVRFTKIKKIEQVQGWKKSGRDTSDTPDSAMDEILMELKMISSIKNMLVVEDNIVNQKVIVGMLRAIGFRNIALASNGAEAVSMVRGKPAAYDILLMDISMPVMDGHQAAKEIRAGGILVPIVAMTAYALKGDRERCLEHGMNDYIAKPVDRKRLVAVLAKWLLRTTDYRKNYAAGITRFGSRATSPLAPSDSGRSSSTAEHVDIAGVLTAESPPKVATEFAETSTSSHPDTGPQDTPAEKKASATVPAADGIGTDVPLDDPSGPATEQPSPLPHRSKEDNDSGPAAAGKAAPLVQISDLEPPPPSVQATTSRLAEPEALLAPNPTSPSGTADLGPPRAAPPAPHGDSTEDDAESCVRESIQECGTDMLQSTGVTTSGPEAAADVSRVSEAVPDDTGV